MKSIALKIVMLTACISCAGELKVMKGTVETKSVQLAKNGKKVQIEARSEGISIVLPNGKTGEGDVTMLYDPRTTLFWWQFQNSEPNQPPAKSGKINSVLEDTKFFMSDDKLVAFSFSRPVLWVRESSEHFGSLEEGQKKVLSELKSKAGEIEQGSLSQFRSVNLFKALGRDFMSLKGSAAPFPEPKIREVSRQNGKWRLVFDGPNKDAAEVVLNDDYQVVSSAHLPGAPPKDAEKEK